MKRVGIIGFGSFGKFLAEKLDGYCQVMVYNRSQNLGARFVDLAAIGSADYVILAIPLEAYHAVLTELKPHLKPDAVIVDVCSVKEKSIETIRSILPNQKLVATHPLFGPESAAESLVGHVLVLCPEVSDAQALTEIEDFARSAGLEIRKLSPQEHDREMAMVQGLTFFIARVLKDCNLHELQLNTPSFKRLLHLAELEKHHSDELFYTIQTGNDQTKQVRKQFIEIAEKLNDAINHHKVV